MSGFASSDRMPPAPTRKSAAIAANELRFLSLHAATQCDAGLCFMVSDVGLVSGNLQLLAG